MNLLIFITLIFSLTVLESNTRAEELELPLFPENYATQGEDPFKTILEAYRAGNFSQAVVETDQLLKHLSEGPLSETASFLRGDLHLKWAQKGGPKHLHQALASFQEAQQKYPDSENAIRSLWRMGQVYEKLGLYYESIGSFKRVLLRHPNSRFAPVARIGIAQTYRGWKKWKEAADAYARIDLPSLSAEDQASVLLGVADTFYHLNDFETAYQKYEKGRALSTDPATPEILFQHAESAYRTGRTSQSRELFFNVMTLSSIDPLAPVALARTGDAWRREGAFEKAGLIYAQVLAAPGSNPSGGLDKLIASIGQLEMQECSAPLPRKSSDCQAARDREEVRQALALTEKQALTVLQTPPLNEIAQETLLEAIERFRIYGAFSVALELESRLLALIPLSHFQLRLAAVYRKTIGEEIGRLAKEGDDFQIVEFFHARSSDFTPPMLTGPIGLQVGISHARLGLYSQAIDLHAPIAASLSSPLAEEALFLLGKSLMEKGDYPQAELRLNAFLKRYPKSSRVSVVLTDLGLVLDQQGKPDRAIKAYSEWLHRYPNHPDQERISLLLAKAYQHHGDFRKEAAIYLKWIGRDPENAAGLALSLGNAYYRLREYAKAIQAYQSALKAEGADGDWVRFQMAKSYHRLGQRNRGSALFDQLVRNAKDPLLRQMAVEEAASSKLRSVIDGNRRKQG
ncbi:MAG: tetratricopeptide repeat protein [Candidatus Manganitrophaceae bacterium]|nr:MAG: tetratricopeptide repeat protein [Candidatus Manganitrophaceae bacterium]